MQNQVVLIKDYDVALRFTKELIQKRIPFATV